MNQTDSLEALRQANPRRNPEFADWANRLGLPLQPTRRRRIWPAIGIPAAATVVAVVVTLVAVGPSVGPLSVSQAEAMQQAVAVSASAAEQSGTVEVRITQDGDPWVTKTLRWNGTDLQITNDDSSSVGRGDLLVVDGVMYAPNPEVADQWIELGPPESVDPDSGTTPDEYLAAIGEDVGGVTMQRITGEMTGLTTTVAEDGTTVYLGQVPAGALARETGVKEGEMLRVLPYGYVAHDEAADPDSLIDVSITVGTDGTIENIHATWGGESSWSYLLTFSDLGATAPLEKPTNVEPCTRCQSSD